MPLDKEQVMKKSGIKEWWRKKLVYLKRSPQIIPLLLLVICCVVYNFNLTRISNTTVIVYATAMGFSTFVVALCSYLSLISFVQAFPKRKPVKKMNVIVTYVMLVISIICNGYYYYCVLYGTELRTTPAPIPMTAEIASTKTAVIVHCVFIIITIIAISLLPVYRKAFQKIDTSVQLEKVEIDEIDIEDEE